MALAFLAFFVSGFAALAYQIVWQRLLIIFSGSDVQSATIIVAAFMTGLGCGSLAVGIFVTGWFCLAWFGASGTLKLLVASSAMFPLLEAPLVSQAARRRTLATAALSIAASAALLAATPDARSVWSRVHGARPPWIIFGEEGSGTSVLTIEPRQVQGRVTVFVNGVGQSWIPYGGVHTVLGALPAFIHAEPREAAVIGLGSGDTLFALAGRREIARITCVEIVRPQLDTLRALAGQQPYPGLRAILTDPRISHVYGDGRLHVMRLDRKYDVIEADALRPWSAYSGSLYSNEYFSLLRDHLKPGGLAVSWSPTPRVHNTFVTVFPHVVSYGEIVVGSNEPIRVDPTAVRARLADPFVKRHFNESGIDVVALLAPYLEARPRVFGPDDDRSQFVDINTDLFPKDELGVPAPQVALGDRTRRER